MTWLSRMFGNPVAAPPAHGSLATATPSAASARPAVPLTSSRLRTEVAALARTKLREGYAIPDVDAFVERVATALDERARGYRPALAPDDVLQARFPATKFQEGYDQGDVDDLLDRVARSLA